MQDRSLQRLSNGVHAHCRTQIMLGDSLSRCFRVRQTPRKGRKRTVIERRRNLKISRLLMELQRLPRAARLRVVESDVGIWTETANFFGLENSAIRGNASDASNRNDGGLLAAGDLLWAPSSSGRRDKVKTQILRHGGMALQASRCLRMFISDRGL